MAECLARERADHGIEAITAPGRTYLSPMDNLWTQLLDSARDVAEWLRYGSYDEMQGDADRIKHNADWREFVRERLKAKKAAAANTHAGSRE